LFSDQLDTPREITDTNGNEVWRWDNMDPFGNNMANENPNGAGQFSFPLRFAGQYADKETNTHYNYFRDYDPGTGRYVEADPIGLAGGINGYTYALSNPLRNTDPYGLRSMAGIGMGLICMAVEAYLNYDDYQTLLDELKRINEINKKIADNEKSCPANASEEERQRRLQENEDLRREAAALEIKKAALELKYGGATAVGLIVCGSIAAAF
jgi:RHS repeat-associated protein